MDVDEEKKTEKVGDGLYLRDESLAWLALLISHGQTVQAKLENIKNAGKATTKGECTSLALRSVRTNILTRRHQGVGSQVCPASSTINK